MKVILHLELFFATLKEQFRQQPLLKLFFFFNNVKRIKSTARMHIHISLSQKFFIIVGWCHFSAAQYGILEYFALGYVSLKQRQQFSRETPYYIHLIPIILKSTIAFSRALLYFPPNFLSVIYDLEKYYVSLKLSLKTVTVPPVGHSTNPFNTPNLLLCLFSHANMLKHTKIYSYR